MKQFLLILFTFGVFIAPLFSQSYCDFKYDYIWILGDRDLDTIDNNYGGSEINFNITPPILKRHPKIASGPWQNSSISSQQGELLFYSNGCSIFNSLDLEMENGDSLNPGEPYDIKCPLDGYVGFQNMIVLPDAQNDSLYYVFHLAHEFNREPGAPFFIQDRYAYLTTVSINPITLMGRVIDKNRIILDDTSMIGSPVSAVRTSNGLGWWIVTPDRWSNEYHKFKQENGEIAYIGTQEIGNAPDPHATSGQGKFTPNGKMFAWYHPKNGLFIYDFNRETGVLSNFQKLEIDDNLGISGGLEFSSTSQFLYVNNLINLYQLDLLSNDIQSSKIHIAEYDGFADPLPTRFLFMERTPDNRIFVNIANGSQYLHVIQEPDKKGIDCRFEQHALKLPTVNNFTLPHFPNYRLGAIDEALCDSVVVSLDSENDNHFNNYTVFPNPVGERFTINWDYDLKLEINIFSLEGMLIQTEHLDSYNIKHTEIFCGTWLPGVYFVQIVTAQGIYIEKVIKL